MNKKIIESIRGVMGVSGVIIWDVNTGQYHKLLPARISAAETATICSSLTKFSQQTQPGKRVIARFQKGWIWLVNADNFALLIMAKPDLITTTLNLVLKSAIPNLEAELKSAPAVVPKNKHFKKEHVALLARTINLTLGYFQGQISRFEIAELLRREKDALIERYPMLKHLTVDANGGVILIKGAEKNIDYTFVQASADLIQAFLYHAQQKASTIGFDIEELTVDYREALSQIGFYGYFRSTQRQPL